MPVALLDGVRPFERLTASRDGSYWNLLMPYALASGFFPPRGPTAQGLLRYLLQHGSRLLGLVRSADYKLYGTPVYPVSGTDQVYGLNLSRFLADNDQPDQLVLSLYGMLAAGMTPNTYVSGEGATVAPLDGQLDRTMLLPPNSASNATFLETLRLMLVHETRRPDGTPTGLELAYSTPRNWLDNGEMIRVNNARTSFGPISYSIQRHGALVHIAIDTPAAPPLRLRLRLPTNQHITSIRLADHPISYDPETGTINLPKHQGHLELNATLKQTR